MASLKLIFHRKLFDVNCTAIAGLENSLPEGIAIFAKKGHLQDTTFEKMGTLFTKKRL
jgi:hypothetical protein